MVNEFSRQQNVKPCVNTTIREALEWVLAPREKQTENRIFYCYALLLIHEKGSTRMGSHTKRKTENIIYCSYHHVLFGRSICFSRRTIDDKKNTYCTGNFVELYRRDTRTIENALKRGSIRKEQDINHSLVYYEVHYSCVHGGKKYNSRSKGKRSCR